MAEVCIQPDATQQLQMYVLLPFITPLLSVLSPVDKAGGVCELLCMHLACSAHRLCCAVQEIWLSWRSDTRAGSQAQIMCGEYKTLLGFLDS